MDREIIHGSVVVTMSLLMTGTKRERERYAWHGATVTCVIVVVVLFLVASSFFLLLFKQMIPSSQLVRVNSVIYSILVS